MKPFSLEAAKRGEPIVRRDGGSVRFVAHVPEAAEGSQLVVMYSGHVYATEASGVNPHGADCDLFMAPKKRTVWLNLYSNEVARMHPTQRAADESGENNRIGGKAWPLEIEE